MQEQRAPLTQFKTGATQVSWRHQKVELSGYGLKTINFMDTSPNLFMIQNPTPATLYIGITSIPTATNFEWKVAPNTSKTFGRPIPTEVLYILNISNANVAVNMFSVLDKFDLSLLSDMSVNIDDKIASEIKGDGIVKGFGAGVSIPAGTNKIGSVDIANSVTTTLDADTSASIASANNALQKLIRDNEVSGAANLMSVIGHIKAVQGDDLSTIKDVKILLSEVKTSVGEVRSAIASLTNTLSGSGGVSIRQFYADASNLSDMVLYDVTKVGFDFNHIVLLTNDGDADIAVYFISTDNEGTQTYTTLVLHAGESLADMDVTLSGIRIAKAGTSAPKYRIFLGKKY